jgi:hypothetical protein
MLLKFTVSALFFIMQLLRIVCLHSFGANKKSTSKGTKKYNCKYNTNLQYNYVCMINESITHYLKKK